MVISSELTVLRTLYLYIHIQSRIQAEYGVHDDPIRTECADNHSLNIHMYYGTRVTKNRRRRYNICKPVIGSSDPIDGLFRAPHPEWIEVDFTQFRTLSMTLLRAFRNTLGHMSVGLVPNIVI